MTQWFYSDTDRNRHGPVTAADLAELHRAGQLQPDTLVWREGLAQWAPWHTLMSEALGGPPPLTVVGAAAAAPAFGMPAASAPLASAQTLTEPASPYSPPRTEVSEPNAHVAGGPVVYAGFWKRTAAYLIDSFILMVVIGALMTLFAVFGLMSMGMFTDPGLAAGAGMGGFVLLYVIQIVAMALYFAWFHASARQATPGKMAVGIKVTDEHGQRISLARGIGRYFASIVSSLTLLIGYIMAAFTDRKRALHDMMAGTVVVDQWAYTAHPERQNPALGTVTKVILWIGGLLTLLYIGLIAVMVGIATASLGG